MIHNVDPNLNLGDITQVDEKKLNDFDLMTWGFPCTDLSAAGRQKGFIDENGNKTRSGMYYEGIRILREKKPKLSIIENVKALTSKKFAKEFQMILDDLDEAGYNTYYKILNAKDYGIPQNRERVFIISIRKDIDNGKFKFPDPKPLKIRLKDLLDDEVDEKVKYLSYEEYKPLLEEFGIDYIPLIKKLDNPTQKDLEELLRDNKFLIQENLGVGEGLVVKRYDFVNCYGRTTWGKLIADEYIERQQTKCATKQNDLPIEKRIINEYFSEAVVEKEYAKILSENPEIEKGVLIPRLLNICFYTLLTEESWNFVKQFKNPTVDFKKLRNEVVNKIKKVKPDLFTKN